MLLTGMDGYVQLITVLVVFVVVLAITAVVTKYVAKYQKAQGTGRNIEVLESMQIAGGKYIQLVRLGDTYAAIAVCRDTVTMLCQVPAQQLKGDAPGGQGTNFMDFKGFLDGVLHRGAASQRQDAPLHEPEGEQDGCDQK